MTDGTAADPRFTFYLEGFHGDAYTMKVASEILKDCHYFVETGANVGTTLAYVARSNPAITCLSCEPDDSAYAQAKLNTADCPNVQLFRETSQDFIQRLSRDNREIFAAKTLFWLDAHDYGFAWPLREEIAFITENFASPFILIDDFKVPDLDCFGFDSYGDQICSFDYIKDQLNPACRYILYYPKYTDKTSGHHPLRGWGLIFKASEMAKPFEENIADFTTRIAV